MMSVVQACLEDLGRLLADEDAVVSEVRIGVFYTAARLGSGHTGVAFTPRDLADTVCCPRSAAAAPPAGRMGGLRALDLAGDSLSRSPLRRAVGVAVLNALSARAMDRYGTPGGRVIAGMDALDAARIERDDRVAMVGSFAPFIKALKGHGERLSVVDRHPEALKADERRHWVPAERAADVLALARIVILTGSALVEGGVDDLLASCRQARQVVLAGPTASPWPRPFFERGVTVLGGIRVLDGSRMLVLVSEGGSGYFFDAIAEKVCVVREESPALSGTPETSSAERRDERAGAGHLVR
jgi:uncharacterized protein (DUF4213/DUF364 family)